MFAGHHNQYRWLVSPTFDFNGLLTKCPEVLLGKYLVIVAFDSGVISPVQEEMELGWFAHGNTMCSARLTSVDGLPHDGYDEWYIFTEPYRFDHHEIFINDFGFSLRDPSHLLEEADPTWDIQGIKYMVGSMRKLQEKFWYQLEQFSPESYMAQGDDFIFVTKNEKLFNDVSQASS